VGHLLRVNAAQINGPDTGFRWKSGKNREKLAKKHRKAGAWPGWRAGCA
jgi:hypothetical protein